MIRAFQGIVPRIAATAFVADTAEVIGDVTIGEESSVWFHSVIRGDIHHIRIGARTNIQDLCVLHVRKDTNPVIVGDDVTVGHRVIVHGCTIGNRVLIGMGAIILDGVMVGEDTVIGAGALVTPGTVIPPRSFVLGAPAKVKRSATEEEIHRVLESARNYVGYARIYLPG